MPDQQTPNIACHFHVPARELISDDPTPCPFLPHLTFDGLAVTANGQHHLILTLRDCARFYTGPDTDTVRRRAEILEVALRQHLAPSHAHLVKLWVQDAWESMLDELTEALTADLRSL